MWKRLKPFEFSAVHSLFVGRDVRSPNVKAEILRDMKTHALFAGHESHPLLDEERDDYVDEPTAGDEANGSTHEASFAQLERKF